MVGMRGQEFLKNLSRLFKITTCPMSIAAQVVDVLDFRIELRRSIEIRGRGGPLALAIVRVRPRVYVRGFPGIDLDRFCVFFDRAVPIAYSRIFTSQQKVEVSVLWLALDCMPELQNRIRMIVLRAGDQRQPEMRLGGCRLSGGRFGRVTRRLLVA